MLDREVNDIISIAKKTAKSLFEKTTVAYSEASLEGVITRFRQQINENSKSLGWEHVFPEMNHNELVGWAGGKEEYAVLIFRSSFEHSRTSVRINISKEIFKKYTSTVLEFDAKGDTFLSQTFYHILLGDWISVYLAELHKVDDVEVKVIDFLKAELAKI